MRQQTREQMIRILNGGDTGKAHAPRDELRRRATEATAEFELQRALTFDRRA
jgi:hypothetical protein